jgi:hypothetical protein
MRHAGSAGEARGVLLVTEKSVTEPDFPGADWGEIWRTVSHVTPDEWQAIQGELRINYNRILDLIKEWPAWKDESEIAGTMAVIAHTAYHLGEIRQALCTLKP